MHLEYCYLGLLAYLAGSLESADSGCFAVVLLPCYNPAPHTLILNFTPPVFVFVLELDCNLKHPKGCLGPSVLIPSDFKTNVAVAYLMYIAAPIPQKKKIQ